MKLLRNDTYRHSLLSVLFASSALILFSTLASAQTPTPTPTPFPDEPAFPAPESLPSAYQPSAYHGGDTTLLQRVRFAPNSVGQFPVVLTIHPGNFYQYDEYSVPSQHWADQQLMQAGFLVFSIDYRLAPNQPPGTPDEIGMGLILGQYPHNGTLQGDQSGRPPQQSNDVKQQILAAYNDTQSNHQIFLVGGSSGATHALWCALDRAVLPPGPTTVPGWPLPAGAIKAVVGLSGPYDLSNWLRSGTPDTLYGAKVENYTKTSSNTGADLTAQYAASPIKFVAGATGIPPCKLFTTDGNPVPPDPADEMRLALVGAGATVAEVVIHGSNLHAFNYWRTAEDNGVIVGTDVTTFLLSYVQH